MLTHVVWDWSGTLLDDLDTCVEVANLLLEEFGPAPLAGVADYQAKFTRFPIVDYYRDLWFDTSRGGNVDLAARRYLELYGRASAACGLRPA